MTAAREVLLAFVAEGRAAFTDNVRELTLEEALDAGNGHRSIVGLMKHVAGWAEVYRSYAFDAEPRHWRGIVWPRGLVDRIDPDIAYVHEIVAWFERTAERWTTSLREVDDLAAPRPMHWGDPLPLFEIVANQSTHWAYHAGEINAILAAHRGEAWEYGEEVEENHISTLGHSVRRPWMDDEHVARLEARLRALREET
jgi:hypothetical protein